MKPRKAIHFAVIIDQCSGRVVRIFNPTFEFELDRHHIAANEKMLRLKKTEYQIDRRGDGMTIADAARLIEQFGNCP